MRKSCAICDGVNSSVTRRAATFATFPSRGRLKVEAAHNAKPRRKSESKLIESLLLEEKVLSYCEADEVTDA